MYISWILLRTVSYPQTPDRSPALGGWWYLPVKFEVSRVRWVWLWYGRLGRLWCSRRSVVRFTTPGRDVHNPNSELVKFSGGSGGQRDITFRDVFGFHTNCGRLSYFFFYNRVFYRHKHVGVYSDKILGQGISR